MRLWLVLIAGLVGVESAWGSVMVGDEPRDSSPETQKQPRKYPGGFESMPVIELRVAKEMWQSWFESLGLEGASREECERAGAAYDQAMAALEADVREKLWQAGFDEIAAARSIQEKPSMDLVQRLAEESPRIMRQGRAASDRERMQLFTAIREQLTGENVAKFESLLREWRCASMLTMASGRSVLHDGARDVDLRHIVDEAKKEADGELGAFYAFEPQDLTDQDRAARDVIDGVVARYEDQLEQAVQRSFYTRWDAVYDLSLAQVKGDESRIRLAEKKLFECWQTLDRLADSAVREIAAALEAAEKPIEAMRFRGRYYQFMLPAAIGNDSSRLAVAWLRERHDLTPEQMASVETIWLDHERAWTRLAERLMNEARKARRDGYSLHGFRTGDAIPEGPAAVDAEIESLVEQTNARLLGSLDEPLRVSLAKNLRQIRGNVSSGVMIRY